MKVGQTITARREKLESESSRMKAREKKHKKQNFLTFAFILIILAIIGLIAFSIHNYFSQPVIDQAPEPTLEPTVPITDESNTGKISARTKTFIAQLESDLKDENLTLISAAIPADKIREVDFHLDGTPYYFKANLDRDPAETAEDARRMISYLIERGLTPTYVDLRVPRKAYYK
ncbi:MAG: hypothetical protein Q4F60_01070 [Candidatus Saccharibacteria bacterium]|nr:hypothetical protein [Candidatus Saccharibacteria bacterium]